MSSHTSHRAITDRHILVDPNDLVIADTAADLEPHDHFVDSVRDNGVLMAPIVTRRPNGSFLVVAGRRRVLAARSAGEMILVRIAEGTDAELTRLTIVEECHVGRTRSTVERSWMVDAYIRAVQASGARVTARSLAADLNVGLGTAQNWISIGRGLGPDRLERLATQVGIDSSVLRALPVRKALRLAATTRDSAAETLLREFLSPASPRVDDQPTGLLTGLRRILSLLLAWLQRLLRSQ